MQTRLLPWTLSVDAPHLHVGRQAKLGLQRGTALICRAIIALTHCPG